MARTETFEVVMGTARPARVLKADSRLVDFTSGIIAEEVNAQRDPATLI